MHFSLYFAHSGLSEGILLSNLPLMIWNELKSIVASDNLLVDVLVMFIVAILSVPIFKSIGLGSVLGYLFAGIIVGPSLLQVTNDIEGVRHFAEYGVVLLMFLIGLELKPAKLWSMRNTVFGLGFLQILVTGVALGGVFWLTSSYIYRGNIPFKVYLLTGLALALSSTAIGLQILKERGEMQTEQGQSAFGILLMQDIAAVPLLGIAPLVADNMAEPTVGEPFYITALKIIAVLLVMLLATRVVLPAITPILKATQLFELGFALMIVIVFGSGWLMEEVGLSMTLGAFIAGLMLADSQYRYRIEAELLQHRDLLLGIFFMAVGMSVDFELIQGSLTLLLSDTLLILVVKFVVLYCLCRIFQKNHQTSVRIALLLPQAGEFCFVVAGICLSHGIYTPLIYRSVLVLVALTMAASPLLSILTDKLVSSLENSLETSDKAVPVAPDQEQKNDVIILGFGRVGETVAKMLQKENISFLALDSDPDRVKQARRKGYEVYYGDSSNPKDLLSVGVAEARGVIITLSDPDVCSYVLAEIRKVCPNLPVSCRGRDLEHAANLQELGATEIVLETLEASLQLGATALNFGGSQEDEIDKTIEFFREDYSILALQVN
ncbi:MAG: cation:proton antiporter [Xenococcaceae cyanobacterium]